MTQIISEWYTGNTCTDVDDTNLTPVQTCTGKTPRDGADTNQ